MLKLKLVKRYFQRQLERPLQLEKVPNRDLGIVVIIPAYDEPEILNTLRSLKACSASRRKTEIIILLNDRLSDDIETQQRTEASLSQVKAWILRNNAPERYFHILCHTGLDERIAGVGLARKLAMDEALNRFVVSGIDGLIVSLDADCTVSSNYLQSIEQFYENWPLTKGCSIYFEHPLESQDDPAKRDAIIKYELFLRYYNQALRYSGFPYSHHTIGSSMAFRASAYLEQGGMNKRKAGEDFYFLHKLMRSGEFRDLNACCVYPSCRGSQRVPFGTGASINKAIISSSESLMTYPTETFHILRQFISAIPDFYNSTLPLPKEYLNDLKIPKSLFPFLQKEHFDDCLTDIKAHTRESGSFYKRFFQWLSGIKILQAANYLRDEVLGKESVENASEALLRFLGERVENDTGALKLLIRYRNLERGEAYVSSPEDLPSNKNEVNRRSIN